MAKMFLGYRTSEKQLFFQYCYRAVNLDIEKRQDFKM